MSTNTAEGAEAATRNPRKSPIPGITLTLATFIALAILWALATSITGLIPERILPGPEDVATRLFELVVEPFAGAALGGHLLASLQRWGYGVLLAAIAGIPFGILTGWVPPIRSAVNPIFEALRYIPPFAWIPIAVIWLGASLESQALVVAVAAFPPIVINTRLGVTQIDSVILKAAKTLGANDRQTLWRIVTPLVGPQIVSGLRIGLGNGWMTLVGAELVVGKIGLGSMIVKGQATLSTPTILVGMAAIGIIAACIDYAILVARDRIFSWTRAQ